MNNNHEKKYKHTRQLLKIAKEHNNYTHQQIAEKAGLQRKSISLVSKWVTGKSLATDRQMSYFIQRYEHFLMRKMEHLFYSLLFTEGKEQMNYVKLSGDIIFKHQIKVPSNNSALQLKKALSVLRIVVLNQGHHFHLVVQYRAGLLMVEKYQDGEREKFRAHSFRNHNDIVYSDHEDSNWYVLFTKMGIDFDKLVLSLQRYCQSLLKGQGELDLVYKKNQNQNDQKSLFFNKNNVYPLELAFYQKMLSLGLNSEHYPFNVKEQTQ